MTTHNILYRKNNHNIDFVFHTTQHYLYDSHNELQSFSREKICMYLRVNLFCRAPLIYRGTKRTSMIYCSIHEMVVNVVYLSY